MSDNDSRLFTAWHSELVHSPERAEFHKKGTYSSNLIDKERHRSATGRTLAISVWTWHRSEKHLTGGEGGAISIYKGWFRDLWIRLTQRRRLLSGLMWHHRAALLIEIHLHRRHVCETVTGSSSHRSAPKWKMRRRSSIGRNAPGSGPSCCWRDVELFL